MHDELPVVLTHAARVYGEKHYEERAAALLAAAGGIDAHRLWLQCGVPLTGQQSLAGWLFQPAPVE